MSVRKAKTTVAVAVLLVAIGTLTFVPLGASAHTKTYSSTVSIAYNVQNNRFHGEVSSGRPCERARLVSVFRVRPGADKLIGSDTTTSKGKWVVLYPAPRRPGSFYAKVDRLRRQTYLHDHICRGDRSPTISVSTP